MTAIEGTPAPSPARSLVDAVRRWSLVDAVASLAVAWHLATVRSWSIAPRVRARSMALVLAVASVLATGSLVAAAAVRVAAPFAADDHHMAQPTMPAGEITDPELDDHATDGTNQGTPLDADHHVAEPVVVPVPSDRATPKKIDHPDSDPASQGGDDDGTAAHDGDNEGSGAHDGGATSGSHDGDGSDDGSNGTSGGDDSHDGGDSPDGDSSHEDSNGGD